MLHFPLVGSQEPNSFNGHSATWYALSKNYAPYFVLILLSGLFSRFFVFCFLAFWYAMA